MRWRIYCTLLILAAGISLQSTQPALADNNCIPNQKYSNLKYSYSSLYPGNTWFQITANLKNPKKPIVKQQLEELAARGDLPKAPSDYDAEFIINVGIKPVLATWYYAYSTWEWEPYYSGCTNRTYCPGESKEIPHCVPESATVYRSIKQVKFVLFPATETANWYNNLNQSPTVAMLYPNYWAPVVLGEGGQPVGNASGELGGPHFLYSDPQLINKYMFPSELPEEDTGMALINPADVDLVDYKNVPRVIPVCSLLDGKVTNSGYRINYGGYIDSDINTDEYDCGESMGYDPTGYKIQSLTFDVTQYDFDFPATFYLGVATEIVPALSPLDGKTEETDITKSELEPSNYGTDPYKQSQFSVYMLVSTPCQTADGGCDMLTPPGH